MKREPGFTLLEVLLAMVILAIISVTVWTTFSNSFRMKESIDRVEEKTHAVRTILSKMQRDLSMAFIVKEKKFHTLFKGEDKGIEDSVTFSTFSRHVYPEQKQGSDQVIVSYYAESNRDDARLLDVYRWTYPYIQDEQDWGEKRGVRILERVRKFDLEYYNGIEYKPEWDTSLSDYGGKMPQAVKVRLELENEAVYEDLFLIPLFTPIAAKKISSAKAKTSPTKTKTPTPSPKKTPGGKGGGILGDHEGEE